MKKIIYRSVAFLTAGLMVLSNNGIMAFASENVPEETSVMEEITIDETEDVTEEEIVDETSEVASEETSEEVIALDETSEENATEEVTEETSEEAIDEFVSEESTEDSTEANAEEATEEATEEIVEESTEEVVEETTEEVSEEIDETSEDVIEEIEEAVVEENLEAAKTDIANGTSNDISWRITSTGKLIITGTGNWKKQPDDDAPTYGTVFAPWRPYEDKVKSAEVKLTGSTDVSHMFDGFYRMTKVDFKDFDSSNVTNMSGMFAGCWEVKSLDLSKFDTSNVTDMSGMFRECYKVSTLDLSNFDTSKVKNMDDMFFACHALKNVNLSSFNTSKVESMNAMFIGCSSVVTLDLSSFDTSNVKSFCQMFCGCDELVLPDVSGFVTSNATDMSEMFEDCPKLVFLDLSNFDTSKVTEMSLMFSGCEGLISLDIRNFDTKSLEDEVAAVKMFANCDKMSKIVTPKNFTLSEFKLPGTAEWKDENDKIYDYFPSTSKLLVTTTYEEDEYFIMYELDGGKNNKDNKMKYPANKSFTLKNPTRTGYTFTGWVDIKTKEKVTVAQGKNYVVRATWKANTYEVVFNGNGTTADVDGKKASKTYTQQLTYGSVVNLRPVVFEKEGYTFAGWTTKADGKGILYSNSAKVKNLTATNNGKVNLYAKWVANEYSILFSYNTTSVPADRGGKMPIVYTKYGKSVKLPKNQYYFIGHTFKGWSLTEGGTDVKIKNGASVKNLTTNANGKVILYAVWSVNTYNVKFDLGGVKTTTKPAPVKGLSYKDKPLTLEALTPADSESPYSFIGWSTSKNLYKGELIVPSTLNLDATKNNQTFTLYAVWAYTFQIAGADGTLNTVYGVKDLGMPFSAFEEDSRVKKDGYYIAGWNTNSAAALKGKIKYKANAKYKNFIGKTIYPVYKANKYTIKFNANGGKGKMSNQTLTYDKDATLKACAFKNGSKTFAGWSTDKNATTATYTDKQSVKNLTYKNKDTIVLYAIWK